MFKSYPWLTPYQFAQNDPIRNIDIDGLEGGSGIEYWAAGVGQQLEYWWNSWGILPSRASSGPSTTQTTTTPGLPSTAPNKPAPATNTDKSKPVLKTINSRSTSTNAKASSIDFQRIAKELGVEARAVEAVTIVESSAGGFYEDGSPKIRFEGHKFKDYLISEGRNVEGLIKEHSDLIYNYSETKNKHHGPKTYSKAFDLDKKGAMMSTSYGFGQIMGFNFKLAGFNSVEEFVKAQSTYEGQVYSFINFVKNNKALNKAMKNKDFESFARLYNGEDYKSNNYDTQMQEHYEKSTK